MKKRLPHLALLSITGVIWWMPLPLLAEAPQSRKSAEINPDAGDPAALYASGLKLLHGTGVAKDEARALELFRRAAGSGHPDGIGMLGYYYSVGLVVEKDDATARGYFETAAEKGSAAAQVNLGIFLLHGRGGKKDAARGVLMLEKAVAQGSLSARLMLGEIFLFGEHADGTPDRRRAYDLLISAAESGNARAQNMVGVIIRDGGLGRNDPAAARPWFEKAARQGDAKACSNLGLLGHDSPDPAERIDALKWLIVAESLNEVTARYMLIEIAPRHTQEEMAAARKSADALLPTLKATR
jgi:TPR repeat protein